MTPQENYILKLGALARSSPMAWAEFLAEFKKHVEEAKDKVISCANEDVAKCRGMALEADTILKGFTDAAKKADELEKKLKQRTP